MDEYLATQIIQNKLSYNEVKEKFPEHIEKIEDILIDEGVLHLVRK